jgi:hypothetical protein
MEVAAMRLPALSVSSLALSAAPEVPRMSPVRRDGRLLARLRPIRVGPPLPGR